MDQIKVSSNNKETQTKLTSILKQYLFAHDIQFSEYMMLVAMVG